MTTEKLFHSERYDSRGQHLAEMRRRQFGKTPVNDRIDAALKENRGLKVLNMSFGDPSRYPDMGPYEGVHRFLRRYLNFHDNPQACASYSIWGDPQFIAQVRRGSAYIEDDLLEVPEHVAVYPTAGVAGALRMIAPAILLPPGENGARDNVIVPKWTYLSHSAEAVFALADVRSCRLREDGQTDLDYMSHILDRNTRAVILATVGNPLSTAMEPSLFDEMLEMIQHKMYQFGHPIVLVADTIYEHFRQNRADRIDAIQHALRLDVEVPVIETSSFSKMMAMAGYRLGFYRAYWRRTTSFREERHDFFTALNTVYGTTLCPVPNIVQKAVGSLYVAINSRQPVEEELAPVAAVLTSLKDLTDKRGGGDTHTMMPEEVPEAVVKRLALDPGVWFTSSALAKRTRKLANHELGKYNVDIHTPKVEEIVERLIAAGYVEKRELKVPRQKMIDILMSAVLEYGRMEHKLLAAAKKAVMEMGTQMTEEQVGLLARRQLEQVTGENISRLGVPHYEPALEQSMGLLFPDEDAVEETVPMVFYRLKKGIGVPPIERDEDGKLMLEGISSDYSWARVGKKCDLPTEDSLYEEHKKSRRESCYERTAYFVEQIDKMAKEGLGVYIHPAYYGGYNDLVPDRLNAFYVLFGFERLSKHPCQAAELVTLCKELGKPLLMFTPGEVFLPPGDKEDDDSYIRAVTLDRTEDMDKVLSVIRRVASYLARGEHIPYRQRRVSGESPLKPAQNAGQIPDDADQDNPHVP